MIKSKVPKMSDISDLDWAIHIKMDYAQNLRKDSKKAKKRTLSKFLQGVEVVLTPPSTTLLLLRGNKRIKLIFPMI